MKKFIDLRESTLEDKEALFSGLYPNKLRFVGRKHPAIQQVHALNNNTRSNPKHLAALEGIWAMELLIKYHIPISTLILSLEDLYTIEAQRIVNTLQERVGEIYIVSKKVFASISEERQSQGILAVFPVALSPVSSLKKLQGPTSTIVILDGLEIQGNIGTILRSCDATGVDAVIFVRRKIRLNHPKLIRSSMGSFLNLTIIDAEEEELRSLLQRLGYKVYLTDTDAKKIYCQEAYPKKTAFVLGSERYGIDTSWYDFPHEEIKIPMYGDCDSLNVSIAATVILYDRVMKEKLRRE